MITEFIVYTIIVSILIISLIGCGTFEQKKERTFKDVRVHTTCEGDCKCSTNVYGAEDDTDAGKIYTIDQLDSAPILDRNK